MDWGLLYQLVFNSNLFLCVSCCAIIQDLSPFICHLNVRSHDKLWFNLPCKTAVWLQEIWIIKGTTRRLSLWAQQGIQTPQTKNMRLDYEEWMRVVSQQRRAALLCCWETSVEMWKIFEKEKKMWSEVFKSKLELKTKIFQVSKCWLNAIRIPSNILGNFI